MAFFLTARARTTDTSLLEQVILHKLGCESVPEYKPTSDRKFWYPRNTGFKRAKAEGELQWMTAAAKARWELC
ncbi:hypothetical protein BJY00DRAFT_316159 [Aspergillus carlsbadensis]|nr:hypothetical protein BJY00DRAFT_316159 [Aspergillus carlsbadensis]